MGKSGRFNKINRCFTINFRRMNKVKLFLRNILCIAFCCCMLFSCSKEEDVQLSVSTTQIEVVSPKAVFTVTSNANWTITQSGGYKFNVSPLSGIAGTTEVSIAYTLNNTDANREATLNVVAGSQTKSIAVIQPKSEFTLDPSKLEFTAAESTKSISVTSNVDWNINGVTTPDWIKSIESTASYGNGEIKITVKENTNRISANTWLLKVNYGGSLSKTVEIVQDAAYNEAPTKPSGLVPENNATDVSVMPAFSWNASTDKEGDEINYFVHLSTDGTNWKRFEAGKATSANLPGSFGVLEQNTTYYYKVVADDGHNKGVTESDVYKFTTAVKNAYADGDYILHFKSTKTNPFILIFTGDGYLAEHFRYGGLFDQNVNAAIDAFFDIEPYKSYKEYFTVYKIAAYSEQTGLSNKKNNVVKNTKFKCVWEGGNSTGVNVPNSGEAVFEWCKKIPELAEKGFVNAAIGIIINENVYAGTCLMFGDGKSISMIPYNRSSSSNQTKFENTLRHEMGGHGFGRLADEYRYYNETLPSETKELVLLWQSYGAYNNISVYPAISDSPWAHFSGLSDYSHVGMHEGAYEYERGVWRPEVISCMHDNRAYFNSPSRFYIVKRILESTGEVESIKSTDSDVVKAAKMQILMDKFVQKDVQKTDNTGISSNTNGGWEGVPYDFVPLAPPIMIIE